MTETLLTHSGLTMNKCPLSTFHRSLNEGDGRWQMYQEIRRFCVIYWNLVLDESLEVEEAFGFYW